MMKSRKFLLFLSLALCLGFFTSCNQKPEAKYVFLFIGDGMGGGQVSVTESYLSYLDGQLGGSQLCFTQFPVLGMCTTYSANSVITDSAASGTAIATGFKTENGRLGTNPDNEPIYSVAQRLKDDYGYQVGIFSSVPLNHATPAAFYAHTAKRTDYYTISSQIPATGFEFIGGSGILDIKGRGGDKEASDIYLENNGYKVVYGQNEFEQAKGAKKVVMVANPNPEHKDKVKNYSAEDDKLVPLARMMEDCLATLDESKPFFIMCEGGEIDWMSHANMVMPTVEAILKFNDAVKVAYEFYLKHPKETLILVTADHQTGGVSVGSYGYGYKVNWPRMIEQWDEAGHADNFADMNERNKFNDSCGFGWTTGAHNGDHVPIYSIGAGAEKFAGRMDNTDIIKKILPAQK